MKLKKSLDTLKAMCLAQPKLCVCLVSVLLAFHVQVCAGQTGTVAVQVIDDTNKLPVMGAVVRLSGAGEGAGIYESGRYLFHNLHPGSDTLQVKALGYYPILCPIRIKPDTVTVAEFVLTVATLNWKHGGPEADPPPYHYVKRHSKVRFCAKLGAIRGQVWSDNGSRPVVDAAVRLFDRDYEERIRKAGWNSYSLATSATSADGEYAFHDLIPGRYVLRVGSKEYQTEERVVRVDVDSDVVSDFYLSLVREK
jgi:hypothetical protein